MKEFLSGKSSPKRSLDFRRKKLIHPPALLILVRLLLKVGLGIWEFCAISRRLMSKIRFPHPISVADAMCRTHFDLRDSKRRALEIKFCVRICYMFLFLLRGDWDLGLCTTSVLALAEPKCNGKIRFSCVETRFFSRILPSRIRSPSASTEVVYRPRS